MPFPFAEYGVLRTENGIPLCQNTVPDTCQPFSAYAKKPFLNLDRKLVDILRIEILADVVVTWTVVAR